MAKSYERMEELPPANGFIVRASERAFAQSFARWQPSFVARSLVRSMSSSCSGARVTTTTNERTTARAPADAHRGDRVQTNVCQPNKRRQRNEISNSSSGGGGNDLTGNRKREQLAEKFPFLPSSAPATALDQTESANERTAGDSMRPATSGLLPPPVRVRGAALCAHYKQISRRHLQRQRRRRRRQQNKRSQRALGSRSSLPVRLFVWRRQIQLERTELS